MVSAVSNNLRRINLSFLYFALLITWSVLTPLIFPVVVNAAGEGGTITIIDRTSARYTNSLYGINKVVPLTNGVAGGDVATTEGSICNIRISANVALAQAQIPVTISAQPGPTVQSAGGTPLQPCPASLTGQINGKNVSVSGLDKINSEPADSPDQKRIIITAIIRNDSGNASPVQEGDSPEKDKLSLTGTNLPIPAELDADREVTNDGPTHEIKYKADFSNIPAGDYEVCSVVADKCKAIKKLPSKILYETIVADDGKYDVAVKDEDENKDLPEKDCEFKGASWNKPGSWAPSALDWFGCVVIDGLQGLVNAATDGLSDLLRTNEGNEGPDEIKEKADLKEVWKVFLNIANILFILGFLFIIISQVVSGKF